MDDGGPDPRHLELLRELADRGSLAAVASATHRTPSALSQQLRTAERRLGTALVEPSGRGVRLTEAGLLLARGGAEVATALAAVRARWDAYRGEASGTVQVAGLPSALAFLVPGMLRRLAGLPITVELTDVDLAEVEFGPLAADHDLVIGHSAAGPRPEGTAGLRVQPLAVEPLDVAMAPGHPLADRAEITADDVVRYPWVGVPVGYPFDDVARAIAAAADRPLHVVQRVRDNRVVERLVAASTSLALLPRFTTGTGTGTGRGTGTSTGADAGMGTGTCTGDGAGRGTGSGTIAGTGVVLRPLTGVPARRHVVAIQRPDRAERLAVRTVLDAALAASAEVMREDSTPDG